MQLAHQVVVDPGLSVSNDQKSTTGLANLHGLRWSELPLCGCCASCRSNCVLQLLPFLLELVRELEDPLRLFDIALVARLLGLVHQPVDLLRQDLHLAKEDLKSHYI